MKVKDIINILCNENPDAEIFKGKVKLGAHGEYEGIDLCEFDIEEYMYNPEEQYIYDDVNKNTKKCYVIF